MYCRTRRRRRGLPRRLGMAGSLADGRGVIHLLVEDRAGGRVAGADAERVRARDGGAEEDGDGAAGGGRSCGEPRGAGRQSGLGMCAIVKCLVAGAEEAASVFSAAWTSAPAVIRMGAEACLVRRHKNPCYSESK